VAREIAFDDSGSRRIRRSGRTAWDTNTPTATPPAATTTNWPRAAGVENPSP
jgi:hypothetical protein